jgi:hypothetical protein
MMCKNALPGIQSVTEQHMGSVCVLLVERDACYGINARLGAVVNVVR